MEEQSRNQIPSMTKVIRVVSARDKKQKKEYLVQWDTPPHFTWQPESQHSLNPYIAQYHQIMKSQLNDFPCLLKRSSQTTLDISIQPYGQILFYLGNRNIEMEPLSNKEKESTLHQLEEIFYSEFSQNDPL